MADSNGRKLQLVACRPPITATTKAKPKRLAKTGTVTRLLRADFLGRGVFIQERAYDLSIKPIKRPRKDRNLSKVVCRKSRCNGVLDAVHSCSVKVKFYKVFRAHFFAHFHPAHCYFRGYRTGYRSSGYLRFPCELGCEVMHCEAGFCW